MHTFIFPQGLRPNLNSKMPATLNNPVECVRQDSVIRCIRPEPTKRYILIFASTGYNYTLLHFSDAKDIN